jgi:hypothetical protein
MRVSLFILFLFASHFCAFSQFPETKREFLHGKVRAIDLKLYTSPAGKTIDPDSISESTYGERCIEYYSSTGQLDSLIVFGKLKRDEPGKEALRFKRYYQYNSQGQLSGSSLIFYTPMGKTSSKTKCTWLSDYSYLEITFDSKNNITDSARIFQNRLHLDSLKEHISLTRGERSTTTNFFNDSPAKTYSSVLTINDDKVYTSRVKVVRYDEFKNPRLIFYYKGLDSQIPDRFRLVTYEYYE